MDFNISLSSASKIENDIQRTPAGFSTIDTMGSMVNNVKFKRGYDEFVLGKKTEKSYIWEALSAVAQQFGQTLYENVRDYIDNVSNVDTCKVRALKSMMSLVGCDYNVLDKIGYYPIEIQNLIDILSMSKKYLLSNKFIKQDFLDALTKDNIASAMSPSVDQSSGGLMYDYAAEKIALSDESFLSIGIASSDTEEYLLKSTEAFNAYLSGIYSNFIYDMLTMHGTGLCANTPLYMTGFLSNMYGPDAVVEDRYLQKKKELNVDINFDVVQVVDDIDVGIDSLDNYFGDELSLLLDEIDYRRSPASDLPCMDLTTRYLYYRKQKVVEYAEFVDNMVFLPVNFSSYVEYAYDKDYLTMLSNAKHNTCISTTLSTWTVGTDDAYVNVSGNVPFIVSSYVDYAAVSLAQITKYIAKIRETIKLQARKIFMKGTNNLLKYTANEFLIDYIDQLKSAMPFEKISAYIEKLSAHSINDIKVQEYWDLTEYMNLSTVTTKYSVNNQMVHDRFFDQTFERYNDLLVPTANNVFTNEDLNDFYLNGLGLANTLYPMHSDATHASKLSSNLYEFLSVLFDIGANTSYYNSDHQFGMKLSNDVITEEINADLLSVKYISSVISTAITSSEYEFDELSNIEQQIDGLAKALYDVVLAKEREGISSLYETYSAVVNELSGTMDALTSEFNTTLTSTYSSYFCKSDNLYCYDSNGVYMFDYFVGNDEYQFDNSFILSSQSARDWINDDNCYTFALSSVIETLSSAYDRCYTQLTSIVQTSLTKLDFIDPANTDLAAEMDSMQQFVNTKIDQRNQYLQNLLQDLKTQAQQTKQQYESLQATFSSVLASLPNLPHQNFYFQGAGLSTDEETGKSKLSGNYAIINPTEDESTYKKHIKKSIYDAVSQARYRESEKYGTFLYVSCDAYLDEMFEITEEDTLESSLDICMEMIDFVNGMSFGASTSTVRTTGTQKLTLQSIQTGLNNIKNVTLPSIVDQLMSTFGKVIDVNEAFGSKPCVEQVEYMVSYLNTEVSEQDFNNDAVMRSYYQILSQINDISCNDYISSKQQYEAMWTDFDTFFTDYSRGSDYKLFIPANLIAVDEFRQKKDTIALTRINELLDGYDNRYEQALKQFIDMCNDNTIRLYAADMRQYRYIYNGVALEMALDDFNGKLLEDIATKDTLAIMSANAAVDDIYHCLDLAQDLYQKYFNYKIEYGDWVEYVEKFNAMHTLFPDILAEILSSLDYFDDYEYAFSRDFFKNYSGIEEIATDPYYNMKNQTHPSYQMHPFMWNFIEYHSLQDTVDYISKNIITLNYDLLESSKALSAIDTMLGAFGNVIDVWKHNIPDFTGYQTKYERSNHICEYTGKWSEVVGYEGAFYPPAVKDYISISDPTVDKLGKYYSHLNLDADQVMKARINAAMESSYSKIKQITGTNLKKDVWDIFKYYVDAYGNMYILYKKYDVDNPTEEQKLSTCGQLWIRLADSPIAFPYTSIIDVDNSTTRVMDFSERIVDICMLETGTKFILTGLSYDNGQVQSKPLYITYTMSTICGVGQLAFIAYNPESKERNETDLFPAVEQGRHYKYLGCLNVSTTVVDAVYAQCNADGSLAIPLSIEIGTFTQYKEKPFSTKQKIDEIENVECDFPLISYHKTSIDSDSHYIDMLFAAAGSASDFIVSQHKQLSAGTLQDAEGEMFNNVTRNQMNSFDLLQDKLMLKSILVVASESSHASAAQSLSVLQINSDMGYIPSYTYNKYKNVLDIKTELNSSYQAVELLGKSKDVQHAADLINETPDPYATKKDLLDKYMFGRIYEDDGIMHMPPSETSVSSLNQYHPRESFDESINIYSNWSLYQNMPNQYVNDYMFNYVNGHYQWTIFLDSNYSYDRLRSLRLYIYSTTSIGRNPYVVAEMSDVIDASKMLDENEFLSTNYNAVHFEDTTFSFNCGSFTIAVNGTQNGIDQVDSNFSNTLPNINNVTYKYSTLGGRAHLKLDFRLEDVNAGGYIAKDTVKVALVDMFDLSFYNWCHMLDPGVTFDDYWYAVNKIKGDPIARQQLLSIDFSNYDYLSDIQVNGMQIFSTNRRLQFKLDESDVFAVSSLNYYVPCLNMKYPLTFAQAFDRINGMSNDDVNAFVKVYEPDEVFDIEVTDASVISTLQTLMMNYTDSLDEYRVFEDYYDVSTNGVENNSRFSPDDPYFFQYVHFVANSNGVANTVMSVDSSSCEDVRIDGTDTFSVKMNSFNIDPLRSEYDADNSIFINEINMSSTSDKDIKNLVERVKTFARLYIGYDKCSDGIVLYVNYQNLINSPYVKLENGNVYSTTIDDTYAKIYPDSSGIVNIVLQFKQYLNGVLMGIDNVTFATCKIHNISDDKPKFVIERLSQS